MIRVGFAASTSTARPHASSLLETASSIQSAVSAGVVKLCGHPFRLTGEIGTKTSSVGDSVAGTTAANVSNAGAVVIPSGTPVTGRVIEAKSAGRLSGAALLSIELVSLKLPTPGASRRTFLSSQNRLSSKDKGNGTIQPKTAEGAGLGAVKGFHASVRKSSERHLRLSRLWSAAGS
jgi:hypothetical protein